VSACLRTCSLACLCVCVVTYLICLLACSTALACKAFESQVDQKNTLLVDYKLDEVFKNIEGAAVSPNNAKKFGQCYFEKS
jgi:hypothetical protein